MFRPDAADLPPQEWWATDKAANARAAQRNARNTLAMMASGPQRATGNPDDSARVVLCWQEQPTPQRWEVVASWRGRRFWVACHKGEWFITRQDKHPADLRESPRKWRKTEQVRTEDRTPIRSREQAESLMLARVEERRTFEATLRGTIADAATAPAPQ